MELISPEAMTAIRGIGEAGMTTPVMILRGTAITTDSDEYDPQYDYGDDASIEPDAEVPAGIVAGADGKLKGWFVSETLQREVRTDSGELVTVDVHTLRLPVGTDARARDTVQVISTEEKFYVVDTNGDDTHPEWLKLSLRRAE